MVISANSAFALFGRPVAFFQKMLIFRYIKEARLELEDDFFENLLQMSHELKEDEVSSEDH